MAVVHGGETISPPTASQRPRGRSAGTMVNNITINAGMGSDPNAISRALVEALQRYERTIGTDPDQNQECIMAAFDTALTPAFATPANTSNATLFTATADTVVLVDVANTGTATLTVRVGITPSGGAVHWKFYDFAISTGDSILSAGPWFLQSGDVLTVRTSTANDATFSVTGVKTS